MSKVFKRNSIVYFVIAIIILIVIFAIFLLGGTNKPYGNDKESIERVIKSIEGYENESIEIMEIKDIYDERIVGFFASNNPAYIQFSKNQKGNYEWNYIEKSAGQSFASYLIHVSNDESDALKFMIVTNEKNDIAKLELGVNEQIIEQEFSVNEKSVTWIDLPKAKTHTYKYKYFDKNGNVIGN